MKCLSVVGVSPATKPTPWEDVMTTTPNEPLRDEEMETTSADPGNGPQTNADGTDADATDADGTDADATDADGTDADATDADATDR